MSYGELVQVYFERSTALQWYWTIYIIVIGGAIGFSTFRQRPEPVTMVLITILYVCFAYKNLGAIEATLLERSAILSAMKAHPPEASVERVRSMLEPTLRLSEPSGVRTFHVVCDVMTIAALWAKEWRRKKAAELAHEAAAA